MPVANPAATTGGQPSCRRFNGNSLISYIIYEMAALAGSFFFTADIAQKSGL
jgi:hypothetical protein